MECEENDVNDADVDDGFPADIEEAANRATLDLLPSKSRQQYDIAYNRFLQWCKLKKVEGKFGENVFLGFFEEKSQVWKSSTLWSNFSMIPIKKDVDIGKYHKVIAFLKRKNVGYCGKKSKVLKREHIDRFLNELPDAKYLMVKVAIIFGLFGGLRREELCKLTMDDIEDSLLVRIPDTKTNVNRSFCIVGSYVTYCRKCAALRPPNVTHRRFFLKYCNNKCTVQPVGINTFGKMPCEIAEVLKLPEPNQFTGHCFRRSAASLLADSGANLTTIKRFGGWKSSNVAESYIDDSVGNKNQIAHNILPTTCATSSFSFENSSSLEKPSGSSSSLQALTTVNFSSDSNDVSSLSNNVPVEKRNKMTTSEGINVSHCSNSNVYITNGH